MSATSHTGRKAGGARAWSQHYKQHLLDQNARLRAVLRALVDCPEISDDMEVSIYTARIRKTAREALSDELVAEKTNAP